MIIVLVPLAMMLRMNAWAHYIVQRTMTLYKIQGEFALSLSWCYKKA